MLKKSFIAGMFVGLISVSLIGWDLYHRATLPTASQSVEPSSLPNLVESDVANTQTSTAPAASPLKATPKPTAKPTSKPAASPSPTPTAIPAPAPVIDYYVSNHSILNQLDHSANAEFTESQTYPQIEFYADFDVNNAKVGDTVLYRVYEDGVLQSSQTRNVPGASSKFSEAYYGKARTPGAHTVRVVYNEDHKYPEKNYSNNEYTFTYKILAETVPPTFTIDGPYNMNGQTCMRWINLQDNVSVYTDVWAKWKIDGGDWSHQWTGTEYGCISGTTGSSHTYYVHAEDHNGNVHEDSRVFILY